jgi:hypothetical protein
MPMRFVWWRNNQMAGADGHAPIGNGPDTSIARDDKEKLSARVMVPVGHRTCVEMNESRIWLFLRRCGVEHLQLNVSTEQSPVVAAAITASNDDHWQSPVTNRLRIVPIPSTKASTT